VYSIPILAQEMPSPLLSSLSFYRYLNEAESFVSERLDIMRHTERLSHQATYLQGNSDSPRALSLAALIFQQRLSHRIAQRFITRLLNIESHSSSDSPNHMPGDSLIKQLPRYKRGNKIDLSTNISCVRLGESLMTATASTIDEQLNEDIEGKLRKEYEKVP
jgi:hypothetical protein